MILNFKTSQKLCQFNLSKCKFINNTQHTYAYLSNISVCKGGNRKPIQILTNRK